MSPTTRGRKRVIKEVAVELKRRKVDKEGITRAAVQERKRKGSGGSGGGKKKYRNVEKTLAIKVKLDCSESGERNGEEDISSLSFEEDEEDWTPPNIVSVSSSSDKDVEGEEEDWEVPSIVSSFSQSPQVEVARRLSLPLRENVEIVTLSEDEEDGDIKEKEIVKKVVKVLPVDAAALVELPLSGLCEQCGCLIQSTLEESVQDHVCGECLCSDCGQLFGNKELLNEHSCAILTPSTSPLTLPQHEDGYPDDHCGTSTKENGEDAYVAASPDAKGRNKRSKEITRRRLNFDSTDCDKRLMPPPSLPPPIRAGLSTRSRRPNTRYGAGVASTDDTKITFEPKPKRSPKLVSSRLTQSVKATAEAPKVALLEECEMEEEGAEAGATEPTTYPCQICPATFPLDYQLMNHRIASHSFQSFECDWCLDSFKRPMELFRHILLEHGDRLLGGEGERIRTVGPYW